MWGTTDLEEKLGHFSWTLRLAKNIVGYLVVIVPFLVCKFILDRSNFNEKSGKKGLCHKLVDILFYGNTTGEIETSSKSQASVSQDE